MTHIFISYAKKDTKSLATDLADKLNMLEAVSAWVDVEGIDYGDEWETLIQRQIARCDYMVVLYSPDINRHIDDESQTESYVIKEIHYAQMRKKPIIPVMAQETELPMSLISIQYIDYANEGISSSELVNRLCKRMKITPTPKASVVSVVSSKSQIAIPPKPKIILPQPFDWCYIPAGKVILTPDDVLDSSIYIKEYITVNLSPYWISKYPITNKQYMEFVKDGYEDFPSMYPNSEFSGDNYPVVGVFWSFAIKFCQWLSNKTNQMILLPTDAQWQYAAQGDDGRKYPWGNNFDKNLSNTAESGIGKTTPVTQYPNGASPFGVIDMVGNVWKWCLTEHDTGSNKIEIGMDNKHILRGGSWFYMQNKAKVSVSNGYSNNYANDIGFCITCQVDAR